MATYESIGNVNLVGYAFWSTAFPAGFDASYSPDGMIEIRDGGSSATINISATTNELWLHFNVYKNSSSTFGAYINSPLVVRDSVGNILLELVANTNTINHRIYYRDGGVLVDSLQDIIWAAGSAYNTMDIHVTTNAVTGSYEIYQDNTLVWSISGVDSGTNPITKIIFGSSNPISNVWQDRPLYGYSEFYCGIGNSPTVGKRVFNAFVTGNSATNTAWNGDYTALDETGSTGDGSFIYTNGVGNRIGFTAPVLPVTVSSIEAVGVSTTSFVGSGSVRDYQHSLRIGGTDYDQGAILSTEILAPHETVTQTNPATGLPWAVSDLSAIEYGVIST